MTRITRWGTEHLEAAADVWKAWACDWESAYASVAREIWHPGGTPWQGAAADAAAQRVVADRRVVLGAADRLRHAAAVARAGAVEIRAARDLVLKKIATAREAGFDVGDDLSIEAPMNRRALAEEHARTMWSAADALVAADNRVAHTIDQAAKGLQDLWFSPISDKDWGQVLLADYVGLTAPVPEAPHLVYCHPSARPDFWWCEGLDVGGGPYAFGSPFDASGVA